MTEPHELSALELAAAIRQGDIGPVEVVDAALRRIDELDPELGAFVTVTADQALTRARDAEARLARDGPVPPLLGVPTAIKDLNAVAGVPAKLGSRVYVDNLPGWTDYVVTLLEDAGAISLGKTATPEFGLPCYTETDIGPPTRTPWDTSRSAGGSSGGAGAATAAGLVSFAQGSDGGGSIRIPASCCGLVGLKPSRGRVSKGPVDLDSARLSVFGPLARTVRDAAAVLDVMAAPQPGDPDRPPAGEGSFLAACDQAPGRLRIGRFTDSPMQPELDPAVRRAWEQASTLLADLGHAIEDTTAPMPAEAVADFETVWSVNAASVPVPAGAEEELRPLTRHLRERGRAVSGAGYAGALGRLGLHARRAIAAHAAFDAVLTPTLAQLPRPIGWFDQDGDPAADFERQKRFTPYTAIYNTTGQPAISLPLYVSDEGLPIGIMLVGRPADERTLLRLAAQLEEALPWHGRRPAVR